ncbi:hypothetical protein C0992_006213 [Termitomyces sp. T32_za158]|nr:hypothetical protein C0992_006213 [Termitomyces sp. T32_za158]
MPKAKGHKSAAARHCEAVKRGHTDFPLPQADSINPELLADPTYEQLDSDSDSEPERGSPKPPITQVDLVTHSETLAQKRKERRENADLIPERPAKISRTTEWRNQKGKTKKARAAVGKQNIVLFFKVNNIQCTKPESIL